MPSRNKTIAKNTVILYIRMFIVTIITLYTSRVVLQTLGVCDFGIFNLAGSFISFFTVFNGAMSSSVQRFLNIELGRADKNAYANAFNTGIEIHLLLAILILIIGESIGLYAFTKWLNIPSERTNAAMLVYQTSLLSSLTTIIRTPFNACVVANERVSFFAYISIFETIAKLLMVVSLAYQPYDNLKVYALSILFINIILLLFYMGYVYMILKSPKFKYVSFRTDVFKRMTKYSSWNFLGNVSYVFTWQGVNMMLNVFHGVALNAAMGISNQVTNTISSFTSNFQIAYKPAIIQTYVQDKQQFEQLVCRAAKFSFFLLFIIVYPLYFNIDYVLTFWLGEYPVYAAAFIRVLLWSLLISSLSLPLYNALEAQGDISKYQIAATIIQPMLIVYSYIVLSYGCSPVFALLSHVICSIFLHCILTITILKRSLIRWHNVVIIIYTRVLSLLLIGTVLSIIIRVEESCMSILVKTLSAVLIIYVVGINDKERKIVHKLIKEKLSLLSR